MAIERMHYRSRWLSWLWLLCLMSAWAPAQAANSLLFLSVSPVQPGKFLRLSGLAEEAGLRLDYRFLDAKDAEPLRSTDLEGYRLILIDAPYGAALSRAQSHLGPLLGQLHLPWIWFRNDGTRGQGIASEQLALLDRYYSNGGEHNFRGFFCQLAQQLQRTQEAGECAAVKIYPTAAIYHPDVPGEVFASLAEFYAWKGLALDDPRPLVGVLFHKSAMDNGLTGLIDASVRRLEAAGALAVPLYSGAMGIGEIQPLLSLDGQLRANVLINTQIVLNADGRRGELDAMGIPVLQTISYRKGELADWQADVQGMDSQDIPFYLVQPEYAGMIDPLFVAYTRKVDGDQVAIDWQLQSLLNKALRLAALQHKPAAEKKAALFYYNYPPGENNLGASFLNVPRSVERLLQGFAERGYSVPMRSEEQLIEALTSLLRPFYRDGALAELLAQDRAARLPLAEYQAWFASLPPDIREPITQRWGSPEQANLLLSESGQQFFAIPRLQLGNLVLLPQPPRGERLDDREKALYHDTKTPPSHSYLAVYLWARQVFASDALIHLGTHGSYEWQPGKERGLDVNEYPYLVVGDLPVLYPYIVDNIGEALQTKRRGRAVTISHNTPAFSPAGLHGSLNELHDLLHRWLQMSDGEVREVTARDILERVREDKLDKDLAYDLAGAEQDFAAFADALHIHLHDLALFQQPLGLASFGVPAESDLRLLTVMQMLGQPLLAALAPDDPQEQLVGDYQKIRETPVWQLLDKYVRKNQQWRGDAQLGALLEQGRGYWRDLSDNRELDGFFRALDGRHLATSYGGDPIKNPDSLPTGRNLYGFDPSRVPTRQAWEAGRQAAERLIETHLEKHGEYPQKLAFSLWSVETMRHFGILEAQVLAVLGFEPQWDAGGRVVGIRAIPREELGRPRVDAVISATGLYRDHFPNIMRWMAAAADQASELEEADNPVATNSRAVEIQLRQAGMGEGDARLAARTRIFSSESGTYGTGLDGATLASDSFGEGATGGQDRAAGEAKLAELYLERMQFAYGPDSSRWGEKQPVNVYAEQLKGVQGAVLSRSSNLYGMLTTDDPFQYLGGIGLAVRHLSGQSPELYISNLRDGDKPKVETAAGFLARDLRARYFHPGWIGQMQKEGYSGTLEVLGTANNLWGWQVTAPETVRDDQWQEFKAVYIDDKYELQINEWFEQHNPHAQAQLIERMLEAARKEYWQADAATLQQLAERWQELAERHDIRSENAKFSEYLGQAVAGFGLSAPANVQSNAEAVQEPASSSSPVQPVQGQRLEKQNQSEPQPFSWLPLLGLLLMVLALLGGILRQARYPTYSTLNLGRN